MKNLSKVAIRIQWKIKNTFPALSHKNFRYFWLGQCVSLIGTWMQNIGQSWLVLKITNSPFKLGLIGAMQFLPMMLFSLFAGVFIDRFNKKKILLLTQTTLMSLAFILATLVWTGVVQYWHVLILAGLLGLVNTIDMPTRQSFMIELVGKNHLMNAIALNSSIFNAARIIGPGVAGILMGSIGIAACFYINALSFLPVIYGIFKIDVVPQEKPKKPKGNVIKDIREGLTYILQNKVLMRTLLIIGVVSTFAMNFSVLIPVLAKNVLHQQEKGFGFLMSSMGIGSLIAAITMAVISKNGPKGKLLFGSAMMNSLLLFMTGFNKFYFIAVVLLIMIGFFNVAFSTTANSTMQLNTEDRYRGRVMSVYALVFGGVTPIGNFFAGTVTDRLGVSMAFILSGIITALFVLFLTVFVRSSKEGKPLREIS